MAATVVLADSPRWRISQGNIYGTTPLSPNAIGCGALPQNMLYLGGNTVENSSVELTFTGSLTLYGMIGPLGGSLEIQVDGVVFKTVDEHVDNYDFRCEPLASWPPTGLNDLKGSSHVMRVTYAGDSEHQAVIVNATILGDIPGAADPTDTVVASGTKFLSQKSLSTSAALSTSFATPHVSSSHMSVFTPPGTTGLPSRLPGLRFVNADLTKLTCVTVARHPHHASAGAIAGGALGGILVIVLVALGISRVFSTRLRRCYPRHGGLRALPIYPALSSALTDSTSKTGRLGPDGHAENARLRTAVQYSSTRLQAVDDSDEHGQNVTELPPAYSAKGHGESWLM